MVPETDALLPTLNHTVLISYFVMLATLINVGLLKASTDCPFHNHLEPVPNCIQYAGMMTSDRTSAIYGLWGFMGICIDSIDFL